MPHFGQPLLPAFGRDQSGLDGTTLLYLASSGTADTTAPLALTQQGIAPLPGTRELVTLGGFVHGFDMASAVDIMTWSLAFLDAQVRGLPGGYAPPAEPCMHGSAAFTRSLVTGSLWAGKRHPQRQCVDATSRAT